MSIGRTETRLDASAKVDGTALYPGDLPVDNALSAKVVFTNQPHARLLSLDIDPTLAIEGVVDVITAQDIPLNEYGLTMFDQPVLIGHGNGASKIPSDVSRWEADQLAVVIAESDDAALAGAKALVAEWEELPLAPDIARALEGSVLVHPENGLDTNAYYKLVIRKGDMDAGWAEADVVVEGTYRVPHQEHAYLQPEAAVSYMEGDVVTVQVAGQWTHEDREQIAHALELDEEKVRVIYPAIGGAFGGREDMSLQIVLAAASRKLAARGIERPIRTVWNREESIVGHHKRHRAEMTTRWGATKDGRIVALEATAHLDAGAYNYTSNKVLANLHMSLAGPYNIPNAHIDSYAVYTHSVPGGAFRGFGGPQGTFASECQMNKIADALGMDPVEVRRVNLLHDGDDFITQTTIPDGVSIGPVIDALVKGSRWDEPLRSETNVESLKTLGVESAAIRRGRGMACALKNVGFTMGFPERCEATVTLLGDDDGDAIARANLAHAGADVGQGAHTAFLQMAADAIGIPFDHVEGTFSDTATSGDSGSASASRLTFMAGNSILGAVEEALKAWNDGERPATGHFRYTPPPTEAIDSETGRGNAVFALGYVADAVDIAVDIETGHIRVGTAYSAVDVGRAINPGLIRGQTEGAIVQAHGYTFSENLRVTEGRIENPTFSGYLVPGSMDVPDRIETIIVEVADPLGPWGARGMAEMPFIPYAPAVVAALHDATGVWFDEFPLTPDRVLAGLRAGGVTT
jgi:CO/xanthine dehydrogenase Mo-binding subunit